MAELALAFNQVENIDECKIMLELSRDSHIELELSEEPYHLIQDGKVEVIY
jgi:hypothetical protein